MVSTRGVKFKFTEGERVLCYEPDPTKAKVLYDSKVLELNVSRDSRGRKVPEYLIHFYGWSSSWDRCVKEEFILPDTEENRNLQIKLAKDAALSLKSRRKTKVPPIIKETLCKKETKDNSKEAPNVVKNKVEEESSSTSETSDEEVEKNVEIEIPAVLKEVLEEDWFYITQKDKVIKLPCEQNVISILEGYVKNLAVELLLDVDKKKMKNGKEFTIQNAEDKIHFCKEVMDGLRIYFDFTLPHLLLYRQEKKQFYTVGNTCVPICKIKSEKIDYRNGTSNMDASQLSNSVQCHKEEQKVSLHSPVSQSSVRVSLRNQVSSQKSPVVNDDESNNVPTRQRGSDRIQQSRKTAEAKRTRTMGSRQGLRSSDRSKSADDETSTNIEISGPDSDHSPARPESPHIPTSPPRQTRHSSQSSSNVSVVPPTNASRSPTGMKRVLNAPAASNLLCQPMLTVCISNINSNACQPNLNMCSPKAEKQPIQPVTSTLLHSEIHSWRMLPQYLYEQVPAAPSLIYGAQHLLRLFVKLPELIYKTRMPQKKLLPLLNTLDSFLQYLVDRKDELFIPSYIDSGEELPEANSLMGT